MSRFLHRVWDLQEKVSPDASENPGLSRVLHQTIRKVGEDIEATKFNTAVAQLMTLSNAMGEAERIRPEDFALFVRLLGPFAPHLAEELWERLGNRSLLAREAWPQWEAAKTALDVITIALQVNGKLRGQFDAPADVTDEGLRERALAQEKIQPHLAGKTIRKVIVVPKKLVNIVVT
jgi:leucyl-tRNA synthetase